MNRRRKRSGPPVDYWHLLFNPAAKIAGTGLQWDGTKLWSQEPPRVGEAIEKIERAWAVLRDPMIALQLAAMYDKSNRQADALDVLRDAFRQDPRHHLVRHHAAIALLRHGTVGDVRNFCESVLKVDPEDAFARFIVVLLERFDVWVDEMVETVTAIQSTLPPFIISCPVWGKSHSGYFLNYLCATLLSKNNLPELAKRHAVHIVVFTTAETEEYLRAAPLFARLAEYAAVRIVHYTDSLMDYDRAMEAHYGHERVSYSDHSLAFYYARNCRFALMSGAHYAALAAGRATDALVSCQVADLILNDGALPCMAALLEAKADAVLIHTIQMNGTALREILDRTFRDGDHVLHIPSQDCAKLLVDHIPQRNSGDVGPSVESPIRICWRVGKEGILLHANHYHPICLRPKAFDHPFALTIDPVDSRLIDRSSLRLERIHLVQDASIVGLSIDDEPPPEQPGSSMRSPPIRDFAFWLWGYWGRVRGILFRSPLRFGQATSSEEWDRAEAAASIFVDAIVEQAAHLEGDRQAKKSWRL